MNDQHPPLSALRNFREGFYACLDRRADALFELTDALLAGGPTPSPAHLSLQPVHRRGWGSLYAALARGRLDRTALRALVARHPLAGGQPIYAVDTSVWVRCDAETSPERGWSYHPSRHSSGQPIVRGTLVLVGVDRLPRGGHERQALWLWWRGPGAPELAMLWRAYVRRFDQEHTFRFVKQALNWTVPRLRHPEQAY